MKIVTNHDYRPTGAFGRYVISYAKHRSSEKATPVTIEKVCFDTFDKDMGMSITHVVHWTNAFEYADKDKCGGLGISGVYLSDGRWAFASGRWYNQPGRENNGFGMVSINVGPYGGAWMTRRAETHAEADEAANGDFRRWSAACEAKSINATVGGPA